MLAIKLDKQIPCEFICKQTQDLINAYSKENSNINNSVLVIDIKVITDSPPQAETLMLPDKTI